MNTPPDNRMKAMLFEHPGAIPISVWLLPAAWMAHREALHEIAMRHPDLFGPPRDAATVNFDAVGGTYAMGEHTDAWGCVWKNIAQGFDAQVVNHPLPERAMVNAFTPPPPGDGIPHGFLFLRLTYLRGYEEAMIDFAEEPSELQRLIDIVSDYNISELARMERLDPIQYFGDDLGAQTALPISPVAWRKYLKPCYKKLYDLCHHKGSYVFMHTDGHILPIIGDLIDCGVNVINPQVRANGLAGLAAECKGKVCVSLDLDRQLFPFCTPAEIDTHVREVVEALGSPQGGLWLHAEIGPDVPLENVEAICGALERYQYYFSEG